MRISFCFISLILLLMCELVIGQEIPAGNDSLVIGSQQNDDWLSSDKATHFVSSAFITAGGFYFFHQEQNVECDKSLLISASVTLAIGIGKEIYDRKNPKHVASWKDLVADIAGIGLAFLILKR